MESTVPYLFILISVYLTTILSWCLKEMHNFVVLFCFTRLKDSSGWQHAFTSPHIENCIERIAINAKMGQAGGGEASSKMVAISYGSQVRLWGVSEDGTRTDVG